MSAYKTSKIFVVGGTGAQGIPVIRGLVKDKKYSCRVLTRDASSARAKQLIALGNVELITGSFASEKDLRDGFRGCDGAFINVSSQPYPFKVKGRLIANESRSTASTAVRRQRSTGLFVPTNWPSRKALSSTFMAISTIPIKRVDTIPSSGQATTMPKAV